jgi:glycerate 2-kinase
MRHPTRRRASAAAERAPSVLCAPDKFRGALDAPAAAAALAEGVRAAGLPALLHPLADGGEGTLDALLAASPRARVSTHTVPGPLGDPVSGRVGSLGETAVIELADAAGLALLPAEERDVMGASTAGVGMLMRAAERAGAREIVVSLGGSATVDGGLGALRALGARLLDADGGELAGSGADLARLARVELDPRAERLYGRIAIAADVAAPLCGAAGAARLFGAQKGASADQIAALDAGLGRLARVLELEPSAPLGAAGGFAAPFQALLGARVVSGIEMVMRLTGFERVLAGAALCLTGEGGVDRQSAQGKTVAGVAACARRFGVPVVVLAGTVDGEAGELYAQGATAVLPIGRQVRPLADALAATAADLRWGAESVCRLWSDFRMEKTLVASRDFPSSLGPDHDLGPTED